jgi:hypothetical protein
MKKTSLTNNLPKTNPRHRKRRVTGRQRRTPKNGVISTKSPGTTPMNVAQNSHWCPRSKTRTRTLIQKLILKILVNDRSLTQTPLLLSQPMQTLFPLPWELNAILNPANAFPSPLGTQCNGYHCFLRRED